MRSLKPKNEELLIPQEETKSTGSLKFSMPKPSPQKKALS
jgi:hypothetical protein